MIKYSVGEKWALPYTVYKNVNGMCIDQLCCKEIWQYVSKALKIHKPFYPWNSTFNHLSLENNWAYWQRWANKNVYHSVAYNSKCNLIINNQISTTVDWLNFGILINDGSKVALKLTWVNMERYSKHFAKKVTKQHDSMCIYVYICLHMYKHTGGKSWRTIH